MPIYLGTQKMGFDLGTTSIAKVYLGTTLVYDKGGGPTPPSAGVLYDNGFVTGISWQGNYLPRPPYTSIASYNFEANDMALIVASEENYSNVNHNCHVCTADLITVPAGASSMKIIYNCFMEGNYLTSPYLKFGLLSASAATSVDDTGGQLSAWTESYNEVQTTLTLSLGSGIAGNAFRAVVNMRRTAQAYGPATIRIYKVWFE